MSRLPHRALATAWLVAAGVGTGAVAQQFEPCPERFGDDAHCTWVDVLEDRAEPTGRVIRLRVVLLPARTDVDAEPLVMLPGGPGQAASGLIPLARQVYGEVQDTRDILFIGQRGTGESNALQCHEDVTSRPQLVFGDVFDDELIRACNAKVSEHADPSFYTTAHYVADIHQILTELGYERAVLWGGSGGTRTALAFMREHPDRVVAAALDGVTPLDYAMPLPFSQYVDRAWSRVVSDCAAQPDCAAAYPDLDDGLARVLGRFDGGSVTTSVQLPDGRRQGVAMHRGDFAYALRGMLYSPAAISTLPARIHEAAATGDLSFFAQSLFQRSAALRGTVVAMGLHLSVYCAEDVPRIPIGSADARVAGTILGTYVIDEYRSACEAWPVSAAGNEWYRPVRSGVPVLLLSGYYDPSTPDEAAERVAAYLPNSLHIVVRDQSHGAGFACARPAVARFLIEASTANVVNPCPDQPIRFEIEAGEG
jgi:pimeloyl-ACP methyl ester carboxylesterase